jgi:hypothetical protein
MSEIDQADRSKRHWVLVEKVSIDKGKEGSAFHRDSLRLCAWLYAILPAL